MISRKSLLICLLALTLSCTPLRKLDDLREVEIDKSIEKSERLKALASVCKELGDLENFELISRAMSTHEPDALYYYYRSEKPFAEVNAILLRFANDNDWSPFDNPSINPTIGIEKKGIRVILQYGGMREAQYGITCQISTAS